MIKKKAPEKSNRKKPTRASSARAVDAEVVTDSASGAAAEVVADNSRNASDESSRHSSGDARTRYAETALGGDQSSLIENFSMPGDDATMLGSDIAERARAEAAEWGSRGWTPSNSLSDPLPDAALSDTLPGPLDGLESSDLENSDLKNSGLQALPAGETALVAADPVALYMSEVKRYPLLSREQEEELAKRYKETGDPRAAEMLVTSNLRFVVKVAAEYSKFGARLIDLIQEGNVGLMHAVREFNPYRGVRLITYAVWWIRGYIQDYLMRQYSIVRIGTTQAQRKLFYRLQKEKDLLESMGQEATVKLLSSRLGVTEDEVTSMSQRLRERDVSLQQTVDENSNTTLLDFEASHDEPIDERLGKEEMLALLHSGIEEIKDDLNDRERELLEDRLLADEPLTLQEIGEKYGVTREAVRQMENRLMLKIKKALEARLRPAP